MSAVLSCMMSKGKTCEPYRSGLAFDLHSVAKRLIDEIIAKAETGLEKAIESSINEKNENG